MKEDFERRRARRLRIALSGSSGGLVGGEPNLARLYLPQSSHAWTMEMAYVLTGDYALTVQDERVAGRSEVVWC